MCTLDGVIDGDTVSVAATGGTFADKNVGTNKIISYTGVALDGTDKGNYSIAATATGKGTITAASLTISTAALTKTYDGTTDATGATAIVTDGQLFGNDAISGSTIAFADKNAGTDKVLNVSNVTIDDGNDGKNYTVAYTPGTGTITKKDVSVLFGVTTKVYDGTTSATLGKATLDGLIDADEGNVGVTADVEYTGDKNVGTDKTVKYSNMTLTGKEAGNYRIASGGTTYSEVTMTNGSITRAALSLVANPVTITQGEEIPATFTGKVTGFADGEDLMEGDEYTFALEGTRTQWAAMLSMAL